MKVLLFTTTFPSFLPWDATPPHTSELAKRYVKKWLDIVVLTPRLLNTPTYEESDGIKIYRYPYFFRSKREKLTDGAIMWQIKKNKLLLAMVPFFLISGFLHLIKVIKKEKIDVIHCFWIITNGFLCVIHRKLFRSKIPLLVTSLWADAYINKGLVGKIWWRMRDVTMKDIDYFTTQSSGIMQAFNTEIEKYNIENDVIPMGTDFSNFHPDKLDWTLRKKYLKNDNTKIILFVWRMVEKKWLAYLLKAMPEIIEENDNIHLIVLGWWPLEKSLSELIVKLNISKFVNMIWAVQYEDLPKWYSIADVMVWPSIIAKDGDTEWLPVVFLEALASGVPTVITDLPWNYDIMQEWINGFMVKQNDSSDLAIHVNKTLKFNRNKTQIRDSVIKTHSWSSSVERYCILLKKLYESNL